MTDTLTALSTDEVLVGMLTENTGRHMLDSGGAYGRNWERNGGMTVEAAKARPEIHVETWERDGGHVVEYVTLDVFHFLSDRLDYNAEMDDAFRAFATDDEHDRESWYTCLEEWLEEIGAGWQGGPCITVNTYNGEDSLSQILLYTMFEHPESGDSMVALSIHGGCDARGGYTAPRMFDLDHYNEYTLFDNARCTVVITEPDATPEQLAQAAMFPDYPVPTGGRQVVIDYDGCSESNRENQPYTDKSLDVIEWSFGETPIIPPGEGDTAYVIASGPAAGWEVSFHGPCAG